MDNYIQISLKNVQKEGIFHLFYTLFFHKNHCKISFLTIFLHFLDKKSQKLLDKYFLSDIIHITNLVSTPIDRGRVARLRSSRSVRRKNMRNHVTNATSASNPTKTFITPATEIGGSPGTVNASVGLTGAAHLAASRSSPAVACN